MKDKKILFLFPEPTRLGNWDSSKPNEGSFDLPLSFLWMAAYLIKDGYEVQILDCRWQDYKYFDYQNILFVGITTMTGVQILNGLEIAQYIRKVDSGIPLVWGGPHPTIMPEQTLENEFIDIVVIGEGEKTVLELANFFSGQGILESILGVGYKKEGKIFINSPRPFLDMDEIDFLPYDIFDANKYGFSIALPYNSSRGCPYACTFCHNRAVNKRSWRKQSAERLLDILEKWIKKYHPKFIHFYEDEFSIDQSRVEKICKGFIDRNFKVTWYITDRMNTFSRYDDEFFKLLKESGCNRIAFGAESASENILQYIQKQISINDIYETVKKCKKFDLVPVISFMVGFPVETEKDRKQTVNVIKELKLFYPQVEVNGVFLYTPYPGTLMFEEVVKRGFQPPKRLEEWGKLIFSENLYYPWLTKREYLRLLTIVQTSLILNSYANSYKFEVLFRRFKSKIFKYVYRSKGYESYTSFSDPQSIPAKNQNIKDVEYYKKYLFHMFRLIYLILADLRWKSNFFEYFIDIWFYEFVQKKILKQKTSSTI